MRYLVIGYGNPSRMDDGVGHWVVNRLRQRWGLPAVGLLGEPTGDQRDEARVAGHEVRVIWLQQLDVGLAEDLAAVDRVWFVDAHVDGPDAVQVEVDPAQGRHVGVTSHVAMPETLLVVAAAAYGRRPTAARWSVRGERFDFAAELTPRVEAGAAAVADRLAREIEGA